MQYVTDRLDLRRDIRFSTAITSAHYDEDRGRWTIRTDRGDVVDAQFFVSCAGMLSAPMENVFAGQDSFTGEIHHTSRWPAEVDLAGKRVGVVGIGATGIQVIQTIADEVAHLTVFARTPQYVLPMKSPSYGPEEQAAYKARFAELQVHAAHTPSPGSSTTSFTSGRSARPSSAAPCSRRSTRTARSNCGSRASERCSSCRTSATRSRNSSGRRCGRA